MAKSPQVGLSQKAAAAQFAQGAANVFSIEIGSILGERSVGDVAPDVRLNLAGMALSGGGIRSAAFSLGVVQAFNEQPLAVAGRSLFDEFDYLSTVSGGGYTGACVSSILAQGQPLPFAHAVGKIESAAFQHLRDHASYLKGRSAGPLRIATLLVQGMLRNLLALLPFILLFSCLILALFQDDIRARLVHGAGASTLELWLYIAPAAVLVVWTLLVQPLWSHLQGSGSPASPSERRSWILGAGLFLLCAAATVEFIALQPLATSLVAEQRYGLLTPAAAASGAGLLGMAALLARRAAERVARRFQDQLLLIGLALVTPVALWIVALFFTSWAISPPLPVLEWIAARAPSTELMGPSVLGSEARVGTQTFTWVAVASYVVLAVLLCALFFLLFGINASSLHAFYRDRLATTFLFKPVAKGPLEPNDGVKLSQLAARPLHLINAAVNLQSSKTRNMRGRNAGPFVFSRLFVGGEHTGYCRTADLERKDPELDLAAAMAISGAAVAPNAGRRTNAAARALLTLANVRLGYWMPNPGRIAEAKWLGRPSPYWLFWEALGRMNEESRYVYLTDGGHLENLGVLELLRRRCRYIVVSDAEADPGMNFDGLAQLIRLAHIDLGYDIDIDVNDLRKSAQGTTRAHCALGRVDYGDGQEGRLLYIKSSVSGDESEHITEYRARNPDFPHETTADQFFDEAQFEAYRALGHHVTRGLFGARTNAERLEALGVRPPYGSIAEWFADLSEWLRPQPANLDDFLALQREAAALDRRLADAGLHWYSAELYPEMGPAQNRASPPRLDDTLLHLVNEQLAFMERAVLKLRLDDPKTWSLPSSGGLLNLFRRWSQAPSFRAAWAACIFEHGADVMRFCRDALNLRHTIEWRAASLAGRDLSPVEKAHLGRAQPETIYLAWLSVASPRGATPVQFPAAMAVTTDDGGAPLLTAIRVRDTYRRRGLLAPLARALREQHGVERFSLAAAAPAVGQRVATDLEEAGMRSV